MTKSEKWQNTILDMGKGCNHTGTSKTYLHSCHNVDMYLHSSHHVNICLHCSHYRTMFHKLNVFSIIVIVNLMGIHPFVYM